MNDSSSATPPPYPDLAETTAAFARIGCLSFGGPAGQIALMHRILVEEKRWISDDRFLHALNYCMLLPGPEAQQLATYVGWLLHGVRGGLIAGLLFILPGFLVIVVLAAVYALFQNAPAIEAVFFGLKAAVLAIVVEAALRLGKRALRTRFMIGLAAAAFLAIFAFDAPFPLVVVAAALIGYATAALRPELLAASGRGVGAHAEAGFLDLPDRRVDSGAGRALGVIAVWGALWIAPILLLAALFGWSSIFTPIAKLFSLMALITFGGAYAALAYVAQQAVEAFGWLKPGEMLDGLAMAETTPGPLVLVLAFVGFIAAFRAPPGIDPLASALIGATLTTWVTFVPCFLWIFLGAPYVERLRSDRRLSGALAAVTAAVVGVIVNLAVWFGLHALFRSVGEAKLGPLSLPWPAFGSIDLAAAALAALAAVAVLKFRIGAAATLAGGALAGLALRLMG